MSADLYIFRTLDYLLRKSYQRKGFYRSLEDNQVFPFSTSDVLDQSNATYETFSFVLGELLSVFTAPKCDQGKGLSEEAEIDTCMLSFVINSLRVHLELLHQMKAIQRQDGPAKIELQGQPLSKKAFKKLQKLLSGVRSHLQEGAKSRGVIPDQLRVISTELLAHIEVCAKVLKEFLGETKTSANN